MLRQPSAPPPTVFVVGDSATDLKAALAAGVPVAL